MDMEVSIHAPYEMMWRRLPTSCDEVLEVSSRNLKISKAKKRIPISLYDLEIKANPHVFKSKYNYYDYV